MAKKPVVLITESCYQKGKDTFLSDPNLDIIKAPTNEAELAAMVIEKDAFAVVLGVDKYTGPLYDALKPGSLIARFGVGYDGIDFKQTKQKNILVTNTPGVLESAVAEFTLFLAAEVLRKVGRVNQQMSEGTWLPNMGNDLGGKTWAIIGLGKIGKKLGAMLHFGFGVNVLGLKTSTSDAAALKEEYGIEKLYTEFSEIAPLADIISIHVPANPDTRHYINKDSIKHIKKGAILVNTGRGSLIDEDVLYDALKSGHLAAAALDVFENEPYVPVNPDKDLRTLPNIVLVPHLSSSTVECATRMAKKVLSNINSAIEKNHDAMDIVSG